MGRCPVARQGMFTCPRGGTVIRRRATSFSLARRDLGIDRSDLRLKTGKCRDQDLEGGGRIDRKNAVRSLDDRNQPRGIGGTLRNDLPEVGEGAAKGVDRLRPLPYQKFPKAGQVHRWINPNVRNQLTRKVTLPRS